MSSVTVIALLVVVLSIVLSYGNILSRLFGDQYALFDGLSYLSLAPHIQHIILKAKFTKDEDLANILSSTLAISLYVMLSVSALGTMGIDTTPMIAGFGITGFTIGFALKEIATNFLSGVLLVVDKPFKKGQYVKVLGAVAQLEGVVVSIDSRHVVLRNSEGNTIMIPTSVVYSSSILVGPSPQTSSEKVKL
jgi:small-conductance mechanosensitive channel